MKSFNDLPTEICAAIFANGTLLYLLTKGTVRLDLGFTSKTYTLSSFTANWRLIKPTTLSSSANLAVIVSISFLTASLTSYGGITHEESPEWTPASSICCIIPPMKTSSPSQSASTSNSNAFSINWSIKIGWSFVASADLNT